ncbi:type I restriction enzyme, S subunit [Fibrella aestuarina BUZ 2]|uniref:Type I restriction enzyme, S subunit n=1 Tax=Fibrella aestuarina BUZ 2 TaxID=1166018 RepID=I0KB77_9BACT|nr:restriction endonuclease subunit S [Fibrella aestuarina]CCH01380.1 type I restriction enzyme, S subunit [Fibrella aestuarina BUZ 2]
MNTSQRNVPILRFNEFSGEWVKSELRAIFDRIMRKNKEKNTNVLTISAQYGLISQTEFFNKSVASKDLSGYYLLERGDFAYNKSYSKEYPVGAIKKLTFYSKGIVSPLYICFKIKVNNSEDFYSHYFESGLINADIQKIAQEGARNHGLLNISVDAFFRDIKVARPHIFEQQKIAKFLNIIDAKIELLLKKQSILEQYKQSVIKQLFSQKIRFKDNYGRPYPDWEEKQFNEVFERVTRKNEENNSNVLTISAQYGLISQTDYFNKSVSSQNLTGYYLLQKGDFAYNKSYSNGYPMGAIKRLKRYERGVVSTLYICFRLKANYSAGFYDQYFDSGYLNSEIRKIAQEGARNHGLLNVSVVEFFRDITIICPSKEEQDRIADFLSTIDQIISGVAGQLEHTKAFKKGLLQKLFV